MDYNHTGEICPKCKFVNDMDDANFCRKCGAELGNHCTNQECDYFFDFELPSDSLFCHECQSETTYYDFLVSEGN